MDRKTFKVALDTATPAGIMFACLSVLVKFLFSVQFAIFGCFLNGLKSENAVGSLTNALGFNETSRSLIFARCSALQVTSQLSRRLHFENRVSPAYLLKYTHFNLSAVSTARLLVCRLSQLKCGHSLGTIWQYLCSHITFFPIGNIHAVIN